MNLSSEAFLAGDRWSSKHYRAFGAWVVVLGLLVRLLAACVWQWGTPSPTFLRFGDSDTYWHLARTIAKGEEYQYGSPNSKMFRAPLYPMLLAPSALLLPAGQGYAWWAILTARATGCILGATCLWMIIRTAAILAQPHSKLYREIGLSAGVLALAYPGAIGMSIFILSEALFCPLMILSLYSIFRSIRSDLQGEQSAARKWIFSAGIISGAACLTRPSWSLWPALLFPYMLLAVGGTWGRIPRRKMIDWVLYCGLFCAGICLTMSPWWLRNYNITGKFVPTTLQVGASLYDGWHPGASGSSDENMRFVDAFAIQQSIDDAQTLQERRSLDSTYEWRLDRSLRNAAIEWALENSSDAGRLGLVKLKKTWSPLPTAQELGSDAVRWMEAIGYTAIMILAVVGLWESRSQPGAWLFALPCVYFAVLHMFFIGSVRYRQPAVLALCALGGLGAIAAMRWIRSRNRWSGTKFDGSIVTNDVTADSSPN